MTERDPVKPNWKTPPDTAISGTSLLEDTLMYHCETHNLDHKSYNCPRCDEEERHQEIASLARLTLEASIEAALESERVAIEAKRTARESDFNRANPGEYACPHCKYISLKFEASRCPLCHGVIKSEYWNPIRRAREEQWRAKVAAEEEERRKEPARRAEAADRAAALAAKAAARLEREKSRSRMNRVIVCIGIGVWLYWLAGDEFFVILHNHLEGGDRGADGLLLLLSILTSVVGLVIRGIFRGIIVWLVTWGVMSVANSFFDSYDV
jgi:ssDNA-binding Zn-finger/Zn-ribbon topoisomerase 1